MTRENVQVEVALLVSVLLHALLFGSWQYRTTLAQVPLLRPLSRLISLSVSPRPAPARPAEQPLQTITFVEAPETPRVADRIFMETSESQVTGEQPKRADYYSDKATVAANPENPTGQTGETPYQEGTETPVASTETVPPAARPAVAAAMPQPAVAAPAAPPVPPLTLAPSQEPAQRRPSQSIASEGLQIVEEKTLAMVAPEFAVPPTAVGPAMPAVPSSNAASPAPGRTSEREIIALKSKLTATGVSREGVTAFNVAASPFGAYDQKIIRAVQSRWYALIDRYGIYERAGTVSLNFELHDDGTLHNMHRTTNSAGEILALYCEKAIVDSAPFDPLPEPLRVLLGKQPREVNFTFHY
jgi:hypothetical protein